MREYIYKAKNVDEAIQEGLKDLQLREEQVKIEVLEAGSSGLFGLFKKEAEVKLVPLDENYTKKDVKKVLPKVSAVKEEKTNKIAEEKDFTVENKVVVKDVIKEEVKKTEEKEEVKKEYRAKKEDLIVKNKDSIVEYITKIVHSMGFTTAKIEFEDNGNKNYTLRILEVENSSLLIGKRGTTLNSLQFLAENFAKRYSKYYYRINVDCDDYRDNRKETLEELAINMAKKSKKLGKPVQLEPMTSTERKIIHNALSDIKNVETESQGKEPHRYLIITAK